MLSVSVGFRLPLMFHAVVPLFTTVKLVASVAAAALGAARPRWSGSFNTTMATRPTARTASRIFFMRAPAWECGTKGCARHRASFDAASPCRDRDDLDARPKKFGSPRRADSV